MTKRNRRKFSYDELHSCWTLWRQGLGFSDIAKALDLKLGTIFGIIRLQGARNTKISHIIEMLPEISKPHASSGVRITRQKT